MDSHWSHQNGNQFFQQPNSQDGFPLDMNNLFDFDDALFQGQTCTSSATYQTENLTNSPYTTIPNMTQSGLSPITDSDSPNSLPSTLDFGSITPPAVTSDQNSPSNDWLINPTTGEITLSTESNDRDATKRTRGDRDDSINACWTSPLCPNRKDDLSRPDSCRGECADFLFANPSELPEDKKILSDILARSEPKVILETPQASRNLKRSEMESTPETEGRTLPATSASPVSIKSEIRPTKSISSTKKSSSPTETKASQSPPAMTATSSQKAKGRVPHNQVEKKYRENVNAQLEALKRVVPVSKQQLVGFDGLDIEDLAMNSRQPSKAVVLSSATAYIKQLEKDNKRLQEELSAMKTQNKTLQSLVKCDDCSLMNYARQWKIRGPV